MLYDYGDGLGLTAAQRLARIHAAAVETFGETDANPIIVEVARRLGAEVAVSSSAARDGLTLVGGANA
jgi:hypothetical protein